MERNKMLKSFAFLGEKLRQKAVFEKHPNGWFTEENLKLAYSSWAGLLTEERIKEWLHSYRDPNSSTVNQKSVGIVMAGNIPLVGFHDLLCVLLTGHKAVVKLSSDDKTLIPSVAEILCSIDPGFKELVVFREGTIGEVDAVIATGSDNSSRYFEYYFGKYPHIIRRNRTSAAVLMGNETEAELTALGRDIFAYFGLGCRNVSKLFVPRAYDFNKLFAALYAYRDVINHKKYANNYDYHKTLFLMNKAALLDNGFLLLKEDVSMFSPVASLYYEFYDDEEALLERLRVNSASIQCIVSGSAGIPGAIPFGSAQSPGLGDYADGIDTMKFLIGLN